jgi:hypothetical protein
MRMILRFIDQGLVSRLPSPGRGEESGDEFGPVPHLLETVAGDPGGVGDSVGELVACDPLVADATCEGKPARR